MVMASLLQLMKDNLGDFTRNEKTLFEHSQRIAGPQINGRRATSSTVFLIQKQRCSINSTCCCSMPYTLVRSEPDLINAEQLGSGPGDQPRAVPKNRSNPGGEEQFFEGRGQDLVHSKRLDACLHLFEDMCLLSFKVSRQRYTQTKTLKCLVWAEDWETGATVGNAVSGDNLAVREIHS
jgi:hypothetical protein